MAIFFGIGEEEEESILESIQNFAEEPHLFFVAAVQFSVVGDDGSLSEDEHGGILFAAINSESDVDFTLCFNLDYDTDDDGDLHHICSFSGHDSDFDLVGESTIMWKLNGNLLAGLACEDETDTQILHAALTALVNRDGETEHSRGLSEQTVDSWLVDTFSAMSVSEIVDSIDEWSTDMLKTAYQFEHSSRSRPRVLALIAEYLNLVGETPSDNREHEPRSTSVHDANEVPVEDEISAGPGWYPDPTNRFDERYWDGGVWTSNVSQGAERFIDPPVAGFRADRSGRFQFRYWDGNYWTEIVKQGTRTFSDDPPFGFYPDPTERFERRFWDGSHWTEHVMRGQSQHIDDPSALMIGSSAFFSFQFRQEAGDGLGTDVNAENFDIGFEQRQTYEEPDAASTPAPQGPYEVTWLPVPYSGRKQLTYRVEKSLDHGRSHVELGTTASHSFVDIHFTDPDIVRYRITALVGKKEVDWRWVIPSLPFLGDVPASIAEQNAKVMKRDKGKLHVHCPLCGTFTIKQIYSTKSFNKAIDNTNRANELMEKGQKWQRRGENLSALADRLSFSAEGVMRANQIETNHLIQDQLRGTVPQRHQHLRNDSETTCEQCGMTIWDIYGIHDSMFFWRARP